MDVKEKQICRLCLNIPQNSFEILDEDLREIFDVLLLKMNLNISNRPIICRHCANLVKKMFHFKTTCLYAERSLLSPVIDNPEATFDLKNIYRDSQVIETIVDKNFKICRFCARPQDIRNFMPMDILMKDAVFAEMFAILMPEVDLSIARNPVICPACRWNLEYYFKFIENCLNVEEKINKYCKIEGIKDMSQVKLCNVLHFLHKDIERNPNKCTQIPVVKQENPLETENAYSEVGNLLPIEYMQSSVIKQETNMLNMTENELIKTEVLEIKDEDMVVNKESSESPSDIISSKEIMWNKYKCNHCVYETSNKKKLKSHTRTHMNTPQLPAYNCVHCTYVATYISHLVTHMSTHKDIAEVQMHKCTICNYKAKYKKSLYEHIQVHKPSDINNYKCSSDSTDYVYKCTTCDYQSNNISGIKSHVLVHKDLSQTEPYKCFSFTFKTKGKSFLTKHMLVHKDGTEVIIYKCTSCTYKTKYKYNLNRHFRVHKKAAEKKSEQYVE